MKTVDILNEGFKRKYNSTKDVQEAYSKKVKPLRESLEIPLNRTYFYDDLESILDDPEYAFETLFMNTISDEEELKDIFIIKNGACYLPKGTVLLKEGEDEYYNYFRIKGTDKIIAILNLEGDGDLLERKVHKEIKKYFGESYSKSRIR